MRLSELGEAELLARMAPYLPRGPRTSVPTGDDCMVLEPSDGRVCVTTDVLVEGRHFRRDWSSAEEIGRRAVAQNLADVAGMGAAPLSIVVALAAPADTEVEWILDLARGLGDAARAAGIGVDGGDLSTGDEVVLAITAFGDLERRAPVLRSGARPGDVLAHSGDLGRSAAGLALQHAGIEEDDELVAWARDGYRVPEPPLEAGTAAARAGATSLMDVSDGLLRDAGRLAAASGVAVDLSSTGKIATMHDRLEPLAAYLADGFDPLAAVLTGGEDHGLLGTFPGDATLPYGWAALGRVLAAEGAEGAEGTEDRPVAGTVTLDGAAPTELGVHGLGWDHFDA